MISFVIARRERSEGRGNPLDAMDAYRQCGSPPRLTVDRHGLRPRDDKVREELVVHSLCHCEEGAEARDAAIHRVSKDAYGKCGSLTP